MQNTHLPLEEEHQGKKDILFFESSSWYFSLKKLRLIEDKRTREYSVGVSDDSFTGVEIKYKHMLYITSSSEGHGSWGLFGAGEGKLLPSTLGGGLLLGPSKVEHFESSFTLSNFSLVITHFPPKMPLQLFPAVNISRNHSFKYNFRDFPGSPVVKALCSQRRGHGFDPWSGSCMPHSQKKKKKNVTCSKPQGLFRPYSVARPVKFWDTTTHLSDCLIVHVTYIPPMWWQTMWW